MTPRNLWNLSVQSASVAIMATGMVLIIVSRNIDLSIGSIARLHRHGRWRMLQAEWIPKTFGLGFDQPWTWIVTLAFGLVARRPSIGGVHGFVIAYVGVPSFIVTLGGLLVWRGLAFQLAQGQTIAPMDSTFALLGGGPAGLARGEPELAGGRRSSCVAIIYGLIAGRRRRRKYGFPIRPMPAEITLGVDRLPRHDRRRGRRQRLPVAAAARQQLRGRARHHRAAGRPDHPDRASPSPS